MGLLVDGRWQDRWYESQQGRFERQPSRFRNWITPDGTAGPTGNAGFKAEAGRYHLTVSLACPWAHRTLIMRSLKGLQPAISLSVTHWLMGEQGWSFEAGAGVIADQILGVDYLHQLYVAADPHYTGRVTVPMLWDRQRRTIVSNESADILRMLNSAFDGVGARGGDYVPVGLLAEIDTVNARIYETVNNGVYRAGFATTQDAHGEAVASLFDTLDWLERRLSKQRYLMGNQPTEADLRLFTTLIRFDAVYHGHFKCNLRRLIDYPNLWSFTRDIYQWRGVAETVDFDHIKRHYYLSHKTINPNGIVPLGPELALDDPVERDHLMAG
ncbi:MAG: glutathione S-transferase family protein [Janthinobacterium lividum]